MRKTSIAAIMLSMLGILFIQTAAAQVLSTTGTAGKKILFAYEESNEKLDPWIGRFNNAFAAADINVVKKPALDLSSTDISKYDLIVIYGSVMAFTSKEPLRDWLSKENRLAGKNVALFVTANRWFLKKYDDQLLSLLKQKNANVVDAVSGATKDLDDTAKERMVGDFVRKINK
jgi:hypothetical protein